MEKNIVAPIKFTYLFAAAAVVLLLGAAQSPFVEARTYAGVNQFCRTASYMRICTEQVKDAASQHEAMVNAMTSTLDLADRMKGLVPLVKPALAEQSPKSAEQILQICKESFDGIAEDLEKSLEAFDANDNGTVRTRLSAALRVDCEDAMKESGIQDFPLQKFVGHLHMLVDNCLAVLTQET